MLKDTTFKQKFTMLREWLPTLVHEIKRDLKNEHLKHDYIFVKTYLDGKAIAKITVEELSAAYEKALIEDQRAEAIGEFIAQRWLAKNTDLYKLFSDELEKIAPNFSDLELIQDGQGQPLAAYAIEQYGAIKTYLFSVLNSVVFSQELFNKLEEQARAEALAQRSEAESSTSQEQQSQQIQAINQLKSKYEQQIARLTDNYEKKLAGWQKKHFTEIDQLKKQIAALQRRLHAAV